MVYRIKKWFLTLISDIYLHKYPIFLLYKPKLHKLKGYQIRQIINIIEPGDILLRVLGTYINSLFTPGFWSHSALYIGNDEINHAVGNGVVKEDLLDFCRCDSICILRVKREYQNRILNALQNSNKMELANTPYDFDFSNGNGQVYCTEFINDCYDNLFHYDFSDISLDCQILLPDGIYNSDKVEKIIEFRN